MNSFEGLTVGLEPVSDLSATALLLRVGALHVQLCSLGWITNAGVCHSFQAKLDHAASALAAGDAQGAKSELGAFLNELDAQHGPEPGKHVTDNAYWLLKTNVEFILSRL